LIPTKPDGTVPLSLFEVTSKEIKWTSWLTVDGSDDVKELPVSRKSSNSAKSPIDSGTLPVMFADDKSSRLSRVKPPIDSGMEPPIKPPSSTAVSFSALTSPDEQVTPAHPHTSLSAKPDEQDQPATPREPMWVEATMPHMLASCPVATRGACDGTVDGTDEGIAAKRKKRVKIK